MIKKEDQAEFDRLGRIFSVLCFLMITTPVPLARFLGFWGLGIWIFLAVLTLAIAFTVEKKKKELNIQTFREILAFMEGQRLEEIEAIKEEAKRPYQKILITMAYAAMAIVVNLLLIFWLK